MNTIDRRLGLPPLRQAGLACDIADPRAAPRGYQLAFGRELTATQSSSMCT